MRDALTRLRRSLARALDRDADAYAFRVTAQLGQARAEARSLRTALDAARAELEAERAARLDADEAAADAQTLAARYQAALGPDGEEIMDLKRELDTTRLELEAARREADVAAPELARLRRMVDHWADATTEISTQAPGAAWTAGGRR